MKEATRELIDVKLLAPWEKNPRGGELRGIDEFAAQVEREGGIREDLHVFVLNARATIMQGHRRHAVALKLGIPALWCKVYEFSEAEAFLHLLTLQNGCDPFDDRELALASRTAISLGIERPDLTGAMHRSEETVQLYLDLGRLPHRAQEMVYKRKLALGTAGRLIRLMESTDTETVQDVLGDLVNSITGEPMTEQQAKVYLDQRFFIPQEQRRKWLEAMAKMQKTKHRLCDGFSYVSWEQRDQFVMEGAIAQTAYARADEHIAEKEMIDPGKPMTWGQLAQALGVPIFVAPAPNADGKYLLLVRTSAVRDADGVREIAERVLHCAETRKLEREKLAMGDGAGTEPMTVTTDASANDENPEVAAAQFPMERWRAVQARLLARKESVMQDAAWKPLIMHAWECAASKLPQDVYAELMGEMNRIESVLLALLACDAAADDATLAEVEAVLGIGASE